MPSDKTKSEQQISEETQKREEEDYEERSGDQPSNIVYDFLYQDVRRVGSFLAQFDQYGVRQSVKATESVGRTQLVRGNLTGTVGLPAVLGGSANVDVTTTDDTKDLAEHTFDPLWANSLRLLDYLFEHGLVTEDLWEARLGTFVSVEGTISIIDTGIIKPIFNDEKLKGVFLKQSFAEEGIDPASPQAEAITNDLEFLTKFPASLHLYIYRQEQYAWATLTPESLVTSANDIAYKHGAAIRGHWRVLGILDAWPDLRGDPTEDDPDPKTLDEAGANMLPQGIIKISANVTNVARTALGRPRTHFGVTPLLIYRKVSGPTVEDSDVSET